MKLPLAIDCGLGHLAKMFASPVFLRPRHWLAILLSASIIQTAGASDLKVSETDDQIVITDGENLVLAYQKTELPAPKGADPNFRRGAFIHPIRTPGGRTLTAIRPDDHLHHVGIWNGWVKAKWNGHDIDFWNLKKAQGRVRYAATRSLLQQRQSVGFTVEQEHVAYLPETEQPTVILAELLTIEVHREGDAYVFSYTILQENVTQHALTLPACRYGGFLGYRGPANWKAKTSQCLTSAGKTRKNGHESRADWVIYQGPVLSDKSTSTLDPLADLASIAFLSAPNNHDAPQRLRVWPPDIHEGAVFFNFAVTQEHDWEIPADEVVEASYRIVVADGDLTDRIGDFWRPFASANPVVE